ncbi:hypothetical protein B0H13DRAFT_2340589 [Mycena leptocephala]|nr:hypothetical protein B0H13DRAFT_2340589 [Mycena leptocephala]
MDPGASQIFSPPPSTSQSPATPGPPSRSAILDVAAASLKRKRCDGAPVSDDATTERSPKRMHREEEVLIATPSVTPNGSLKWLDGDQSTKPSKAKASLSRLPPQTVPLARMGALDAMDVANEVTQPLDSSLASVPATRCPAKRTYTGLGHRFSTLSRFSPRPTEASSPSTAAPPHRPNISTIHRTSPPAPGTRYNLRQRKVPKALLHGSAY